MEYENFKEQFVEDVKAGLSDSGIEANMTVNTVNKLNDSYEAMTITPEGTNIGVNLPIEKFYEAYDDGMSYDAVVDKAVDTTIKGFEQAPIVDVAAFGEYEQMKDKLVMEVVSVEANKGMLETVPHKDIEDMAVVYRFVLESNDESRASVLVTNRMMENILDELDMKTKFDICIASDGEKLKTVRAQIADAKKKHADSKQVWVWSIALRQLLITWRKWNGNTLSGDILKARRT